MITAPRISTWLDLQTGAIVDTAGKWRTSLQLDERAASGPNTSFRGAFQFAWDGTSVSAFRACPRKYQLSVLRGYCPREPNPPLAFGLALHKCLEIYHKMTAADFAQEQIILRITQLALLLGEQIPPGDSCRTKETLTRTVVWYVDQFTDDACEPVLRPDGSVMAEYSFALPLFTLDGIDILYCGHFDRPTRFQNQIWISDYKTTSYELDDKFFSMFIPDTQMAGYTIAGHVLFGDEMGGIIIDGVQLGVNFTRFRRKMLQFRPDQIEEDITDLKYTIREAKRCADEGYWPKNPSACGRYFKTSKGIERAVLDNGCPYRYICAKPPAIREPYLRGNFSKQVWDPLKAR